MVVSYNLWPVGRRWTTWSEHFHCRRKMPSKVPTLSTWLLKCIQPKSRNCQTKTKPKKKVEIIITTMTMLLKTKQLLLAVCKMVARRRRRLQSILGIVASSPGVRRKREWARSEGLSATYIFVVTLSSWGSLFFVGALRRWLPCEK